MLQNFLATRLSPFRHSNFRLFFFAQTLSMVGRWSYDLARAYIVIELIGNAEALGSLMFVGAIPAFLLIFQAGVLVDKIEVKRLMIITKFSLAIGSLALASVTEFSSIKMWHFVAFTFFEGVVTSFDSPAFQALVVRLIPKEDFQQAVSLNAINLHIARTLGPLIAGGLMFFWGPSAVFLFDGLTYILLCFVLFKVRLLAIERDLHAMPSNGWKAMKQGLHYAYQNQNIRFPLLQLNLLAIVVLPLVLVVFKTYAKTKFSLSSEDFGYVFTFMAFGAMLGAMSFTAFKPKKPLKALFIGIPFACLASSCVPLMSTPFWTGLCMSISDFFLFLSFAALSVTLQMEVQEEFRGRVSSFIGINFLVIGPISAYPVSALSDHLGHEKTIVLLSFILFAGSVLLAFLHHNKTKNSLRGSPSDSH